MRARQLESLEQMELCRIGSFIHQLDLETSLSLPWFSLLRCRNQLQTNSFDRSSFEQRALPCAALLSKTRISTQLQNRSVQSFQLTGQHLSLALVLGGVHLRAFYQTALQTRALSTALTLISLSLAIDCLAQTFKQESLEKKHFEKKLVHNIFANNFFQQSSFNNSFVHQQLSEQQVA